MTDLRIPCLLAGLSLVLAFRLGADHQRRLDRASIQAAADQVREMMAAMEEARELLASTTREYRTYSEAR